MSTAKEIIARSLSEMMASLWKSGDSSNLTIVCGTEIFKLHTFVLCPNSKFFAAACNNGFKESETKRIDLPDDNPTMVKRMLQFCYGITYTDSVDIDKEPDLESIPHAHAKIYTLAEKYGMQGLKTVAGEGFRIAVDHWAANELQTIPSFPTLVALVYTGTPESDRLLRDKLVEYAQENWNKLAAIPEIKGVLADYLDFAFDLINNKLLVPDENPFPRPKLECFDCHRSDLWEQPRMICGGCDQPRYYKFD